jgi:2-polyprenyl-6-methoxyphenol hydroxylase-like FAD-dependent oxidoreductase
MSVGSLAVVAGRSMAGLAAAASLIRDFDRVLVLDKDPDVRGAGPRAGVGQGHHLHNLLKSGANSIEALLPGTTDLLLAAGAVELAQSESFRVYDEGGLMPRRDLGFVNLSASRPLIEQCVLDRLASEPNLEVRGGTSVEGLSFTDDGNVDGVLVGTGDGSVETLRADLVVDATGRLSRTPEFLEQAGYGAVPESRINIGISYTSAVFDAPRGFEPDYLALALIPTPPAKRGGFVVRIENDQWMVSLHTRFEKTLPKTHDELTEFAAGIDISDFAEFLGEAHLAGPIRSYRKRDATWRRYDQLDPFPDGLLVLGDAMTSFNPIYGQGISVAWLQAVALNEILASRSRGSKGLSGLAAEFFPAAMLISRNAWNGSTLIDSAYEEVTGDIRAGVQDRLDYMSALRSLIEDDPELHADLIGVGQMTVGADQLTTPERRTKIQQILTTR